MKSFYVVRRQAGFVVAIAALLLALVVPALASAAEVTTRSVQLSSASKGAEDVSYTVTFTPSTAAGATVVDFCTGSPSIGAACTAPTGLDLSSATISTSSVGYTLYTTGNAEDANTVVVTSTLTQGTPASFILEGVTNPTTAGTMYARILTFANGAATDAYTSEVVGTYVDKGSVAIAIHDTIAVSGAVNESLTFCVSSKTIDANCTLQSDSAPTLELGETSGDVTALSSTAVSTGDLYAQISTNAVSGATVNLKSSALGCGGLINSSKPTGCYIGPALLAGIDLGDALFGVKVATATDPAGASGTFQAATGSGYNDTTYTLDYVDEDASGVTSVFGDPFLDTDGLPASNKNMKLTFGASISNDTPAGKYSTDLSLIATGKF